MGFEKEEGGISCESVMPASPPKTSHSTSKLDALKKAGCRRVFTDKASAAKGERPGLAEAVSHLRLGDVLVIWRLDRLGRTVKGLVDFVADLQQQGGNSAV